MLRVSETKVESNLTSVPSSNVLKIKKFGFPEDSRLENCG